jgi:hypothetical protein
MTAIINIICSAASEPFPRNYIAQEAKGAIGAYCLVIATFIAFDTLETGAYDWVGANHE